MPKFFGVLVVGAALFVMLTWSLLPPVVASNFGVDGAANGGQSRSTYCTQMLALILVIPSLLALMGPLVGILPAEMISLPNRHMWLAPEHRAATVAALSQMMVQFASAMAIFLCFVHWQVVRANLMQPPRLDMPLFFAGVSVFLGGVVVWTVTLYLRFSRPPRVG